MLYLARPQHPPVSMSILPRSQRFASSRAMALLVLLVFEILALFPAGLRAENLELIWDSNIEPDLAGYFVYGRKIGEPFAKIADAGREPRFAPPNLERGASYEFFVTAYTEAGHESEGSNLYGYTVPVAPQPPMISEILDRTGLADKAQTVIFTVSDPDTPPEQLLVTASSSNQILIPNANLVLTGAGTSRTLTLIPALGQIGISTITVRVSDSSASVTETFVLTVSPSGQPPLNSSPVISGLADVVMEENSSRTLDFSVSDADSAIGTVNVTAESSNQILIPNGNLLVEGTGSLRSLRLAPARDQFGLTTISLTASDGANRTTRSFLVTVEADQSGAAPQIDPIAAQTIKENNAAFLFFTVSDPDTPLDNLVVTGASSNHDLLPDINILASRFGANRSLTIVPFLNKSGTATVTLTISDGVNRSTRDFLLTVTPANRPPTISVVENQTVREDVALTIPFTVADPDVPSDALTVTALSSNKILIPDANLVVNGNDGTRTLHLLPAARQTGVATITLRVSDGLASAERSFTVTVTAAPVQKVYIHLEAENAILGSPMAIWNDPSSSQGKFLASTGEDQGLAVFVLSIPRTAEYVVWCRVYFNPFRAGSFHAAAEGFPEDVFDCEAGGSSPSWTWMRINGRNGGAPLTLNPRRFTFATGSRLLVFRGRSVGTPLDRIIVTDDLSFQPAN